MPASDTRPPPTASPDPAPRHPEGPGPRRRRPGHNGAAWPSWRVPAKQKKGAFNQQKWDVSDENDVIF